MQTILTASIGDQLFPVTKLTQSGVHFSDYIGKPGRDVAVVLRLNADGITLEIPASGKIELASDGHVLRAAFNDTQSSAIETFMDSNEVVRPQGIAQVLYGHGSIPHAVGKTQWLATSLAGALCVALIAVITYFQIANQSSLSARTALIATSAPVLESSVSGKVEHLTLGGPIKVGEVYAAVRTPTGRTVFLESSASGTLQTAVVASDTDISKGSPLVYVSNPSDQLYVKAYLSTASAAKLTNGYRVEMRKADGTGNWMLIAESVVANDITREFQFADSAGSPLSEVILPLQGVSGLAPGQPVTVRFTKSLFGSFSLQALEIGNSLQAWLRIGGSNS
jgi:hypothetical protein